MILPHLILEAVEVKQRICLLMQKKFIEELYLLILLVIRGFGRNSEGEFYRYQGSNGEVHWNGREKSDRGLKVPKWIRDRFNQMVARVKGSGGKCG